MPVAAFRQEERMVNRSCG